MVTVTDTTWHALGVLVAFASAGVLVAGLLLLADLAFAVAAERRASRRARRHCPQCDVQLDPAGAAWRRIVGGDS